MGEVKKTKCEGNGVKNLVIKRKLDFQKVIYLRMFYCIPVLFQHLASKYL